MQIILITFWYDLDLLVSLYFNIVSGYHADSSLLAPCHGWNTEHVFSNRGNKGRCAREYQLDCESRAARIPSLPFRKDLHLNYCKLIRRRLGLAAADVVNPSKQRINGSMMAFAKYPIL